MTTESDKQWNKGSSSMTIINFLTVSSNGEYSLSSPLSLWLFISLLHEHMKLAAQPLMSYFDSRHHGRRGKYSPAVSILKDGKRKCSESRLPSPSPSPSLSSLILDILFQILVLWDYRSAGVPTNGENLIKCLNHCSIISGNIPA